MRGRFGIRRRLHRLIGSLAILLLCGIAPRGARAGCSRTEAAFPVTVQFPWTHGFQFAGFYAAKEQGYYREAGLCVTLKEGGPTVNVIAEVLDGRADYGVFNAGILYERLRRRPVVMLAPIFQHSATALLALKSSGIEHVHQLAGRRIMTGGGIAGTELRMMLQQEGLCISELDVSEYSLSLDELLAGQADASDAYVSDEPYRLKQKGVAFRLFQPHQYGVDFYGDTLFTSEDLASRHPGRVEAFRKATLEGWRHAMAHPEATIDLILRDYAPHLAREKLRFEYETFLGLMEPNVITIGHSHRGRWHYMAEAMVSAGLVDIDPGEAEELMEGFFFESDEHWGAVLTRWLWFAAAISLVMASLLTLVLFWNRSLHFLVKRRSAEIRRVGNQYRQLFDHSLSGVCMGEIVQDANDREPDFLIKNINAAYEKQSGLDRGMVVGKRLAHLFPELRESGVIDRLTDVVRSGMPESFETQVVSLGKHFYNEVYKTGPASCGIIFTDITLSKAAEQKRRAEWNISRILEKEVPEQQTLREVAKELATLPFVDCGGLYLNDGGERALRLQTHWGLPAESVACVKRFALESDNWRTVISEGAIAWNKALSKASALQQPVATELCALVVVPLWNKRELLGCLNAGSLQRDNFDDDFVADIEAIGRQLAGWLERTRANKLLRQSEERYTQLAKLGRIVSWETDARGTLVHVNPVIESLLHYRVDEAVGMKFYDLYATYAQDTLKEEVLDTILRGQQVNDYECVVKNKSGEIRTMLLSGEPVYNHARAVVGARGFLVDITERKRMENQILQIGEFERRRIGQDLHDSLGQQLTGIAYLATRMTAVLHERAPEEAGNCQYISREISRAIAMTRHLARQYCAVYPHGMDLRRALEEMARTVQSMTGTEINVKGKGPVGGPHSMLHHLYQIAAESVNNAIRHGKAGRVDIRLDARSRGGVLRVRDNGRGMVENDDRFDGMGLNVMQYRADQIGARLHVKANQSCGVRVLCLFPLMPAGIKRPRTEKGCGNEQSETETIPDAEAPDFRGR